MDYYSISEFAKKVGVSKKAIIYYQSEGILNPSMIKENGYRYYTDYDIITIQKILVMKYLGISVKDIKYMLNESDSIGFLDSLESQTDLINDKISNLLIVKKTIDAIYNIVSTENNIKWNEIIRLVKILSMGDNITKQYKNSNNINARIELHKTYSKNIKGWYRWMFDNYDFKNKANILEIGCGNGELWYENRDRIMDDLNLFLTDLSSGMINDASKKLDGIVKAQYEIVDCCDLPFADNSMDVVIANHVLFYASDLDLAVKEIKRVLKNNGIFYCSTYGSLHMKAIEEIVKDFDPRICLSNINLYEIFGLENGKEFLCEYFNSVISCTHDDELNITKIEPLYRYIMSCHGNQDELIYEKKDKFIKYLKDILDRKGVINVKKQAGIFICKNKKNY